MEFIGVDVHKRERQVCILAAEGTVVEKHIRTERGRFAEVAKTEREGDLFLDRRTPREVVTRAVLPPLGAELPQGGELPRMLGLENNLRWLDSRSAPLARSERAGSRRAGPPPATASAVLDFARALPPADAQ